MKQLLRCAFGVLLAAVVSSASANVVYNWVTTDLSPHITSAEGRIEVTTPHGLLDTLIQIHSPGVGRTVCVHHRQWWEHPDT